jgi:hypothetical protein
VIEGALMAYKIHIFNTSLNNFQNPSSVDVLPRPDESGNKHLNIILKDIEFDIITDFDIRVTLLTDYGRNTTIHVILDELNGEFYFKDGQIHFTTLFAKIGKMDLIFQSTIFDTIYNLFREFITKRINESINRLQGKIEKALNDFINAPFIIDIDYGISMNLTNTEKPKLFIYDRLSSSIDNRLLFLSEDSLVNRKNNNKGAILTFGIEGSVYPKLFPNLIPVVPLASNMIFLNHLFDNKISMLISDYTLNHILFFIGQTGMINEQYRTEDGLKNPWNRTLDTDGLGEIIHELKGKFDSPKKLELRFAINAHNVQPLVDIKTGGNTLDINYSVDLNVYTSEDPFEFPENYLKLNVTSYMMFSIMAIEDKVNILILNNNIRKIDVIVDKISVTTDSLSPFLTDFTDKMILRYQNNITDIKLSEKLSNYTGIRYKDLYLSTDNGYFDFSIDID